MTERCVGLHWQPWVELPEGEAEEQRVLPAGWRAAPGAGFVVESRDELSITTKKGVQVTNIRLLRESVLLPVLNFHVKNEDVTCEPYLRWVSC